MYMLMQENMPEAHRASNVIRPAKKQNKGVRILTFIMAVFFISSGILFSLFRYSSIPVFTELRELYIETAMTTLSHQYLATYLFNSAEIERVMQKSLAYRQQQTVMESVNITVSTPATSKVVDTTYLELPGIISPLYSDVITGPPPVNESLIISEYVPGYGLGIAEWKQEKADIYIPIKLDNSRIEIEDVMGVGFKGRLITVHDPSRVKVAISSKFGKIGERLGDIVKREGAFGGINASGFVDYEGIGLGDTPTGIVIKDGKIIYDPGTPTNCIIGFNYFDQFIIGNFRKENLPSLKLRDCIEFSPFLIINGEKQIKAGDTGGAGIQPRTAIGQTLDGKVLMLVIDGRQLHSLGATLKQVQDILFEKGAYNAASVDGGSSTSMWYNGEIQNSPCGPSGERLLPTAFIIK